jgi:putative RecB family exonuclease
MSLPLPTSLSPSKVSSFRDCGLAFRFSTIDRLWEPPSEAATKGTLVHRALELLVVEEPSGARSLPAALDKLDRVRVEAIEDPEYSGLDLSEEQEAAFFADAVRLVHNYFQLEDPNRIRVLGTEMQLSVQLGQLTLRGIIDRLEVDEHGSLVVTDYKTGRAPSTAFEQSRLGGVHFYAYLCQEVLGERPGRIQLLHLREPLAISTIPSDQSVRGLHQRTLAVWDAVERACQREDFQPRPGPMCAHCAFHAYCPVFGGDPALATSAAGSAPAPAPLAAAGAA